MAKRRGVRQYFRDKFGRFSSRGGGGRRPLTPIGQGRTPAVRAARAKRGKAEARTVKAYLTQNGRGLTASDRKLIKRVQRG